MDFMVILQFIVLLGGIYLGVKLGGMGVGYAGGLGVVVLAILGMKVDMKDIPIDVILIIASVISAITALQVAGGLDYLVQVASKILRKNPKQINFLAPIVTYLLTILAGTGHTAFSDPGYRRGRKDAEHQTFRSSCTLSRFISGSDHCEPYFSGVRRYERLVRKARR